MIDFFLYFTGGALSVVAVAAFLGKQLVVSRLKKDLESYKSELKSIHEKEILEIKHLYELISMKQDRRDKYKSELAIRQLNAAEQLWSVFEPTSLIGTGNKVIKDDPLNPLGYKSEAIELVNAVTDKFNSGPGLYISKDTRNALHDFRDFVKELLVNAESHNNEIPIQKKDVLKYKSLRKAARGALREEVGSKNLTVARGEYED